MKTKPLFILIGIAVVLSTLMVAQRFISYMTKEEVLVERRVQPNWVRGSWLVANNKPYTLNLQQQLELINVINDAETLTESATTAIKLPISKIVITRFPNEPDIEISIAGTQNNKMVLQITGLSEGNLFIEKQAGSLKKLIDSTPL